MFSPLLGSGIFTQEGPEWKHSRELLRPQFMQNRSENFEQLKTCVENLLDCITPVEIVDLQPLFFRLTFDTTTFLLFGKSSSSLQSQDGAGQEPEFANAFNMAQDYAFRRSSLGKYYWLMDGQAFRDACRTCHRIVDAAIQRVLKDNTEHGTSGQGKSRYNFFNTLIQETSNPKLLRDQCLNLLLAGRDSTACLLSWTL
jgi:cytochrome P450